MDGKYLITRMNGRIASFLLDGQRAVEIHCDPAQETYVLGDIYVGRIKNIAKNIGAAFVEIAPETVCHLALDDMKRPVYTKKGSSKLPQEGDELLVQISREGMKTKRPSVTTKLTLHGKYVLLTTGTRKNSVSAKLSKTEKERLLTLAAAYAKAKNSLPAADADHTKVKEKNSAAVIDNRAKTVEPEEDATVYSWLFRTNAGGAAEELLLREMEQLEQSYAELLAYAQYRSCFSCLHKMPSAYLRRLAGLYDAEAEQIITDDEGLFLEIESYLKKNQPEDLGKLALYQDRLLPMKKLYSLEAQLSEALREKVWLKSGGYLVIQPTEALTVIDVNTGKFEGGKKREAAFLKINREAAAEIARQLRLRNLSGIIIVDFINMEEESSRNVLLGELQDALGKDPVRTVLVDMTKLSLVEITRQKRERPLAESS